ncbi:CD59 glycoprotein-like [Brienomyrus brachyistius]|uniref:CD59 glycoprotein-like n=1 Tax=Brienomyrus brachyistius TaxID=42636 RepID=UPI0020B3ED81|nr:CD59 glycoprotein-like [Brienomyrus brachyistius]
MILWSCLSGTCICPDDAHSILDCPASHLAGGRRGWDINSWMKSTDYSNAALTPIADIRIVWRNHYTMKFLRIFLILSFAVFALGSALQCYSCSDHSDRCIQDCTFEDACLALGEQGGMTIRRCVRYTDCNHVRLAQMFPTSSGLAYRCCNSNLCNSSPASTRRVSLLAVLLPLLLFWCCVP